MTGSADRPWRATRDGVVVRLRLTPKSSKDAIEGAEPTAEGPALKARVRAVPEDGAANAAAVVLLAKWIGVPKSSVALIAGQKSRIKSLAVDGNPSEIEAKLEERLAALQPRG